MVARLLGSWPIGELSVQINGHSQESLRLGLDSEYLTSPCFSHRRTPNRLTAHQANVRRAHTMFNKLTFEEWRRLDDKIASGLAKIDDRAYETQRQDYNDTAIEIGGLLDELADALDAICSRDH